MADFEDMFDDFSVEMGSFEVKQVKKFDRMWQTGQGGSVTSGVILCNGIIYFAAANYMIYAVRPDNGELVWKFKTEGVIAETTPKIHDGILYCGCFDRNMYAINAETGELSWKYTTNDKVGSGVAIDSGRIYFGGKDQNVYCLDAKTGKFVWKFKTYDCIISEPIVVGNKVIIGSYDHNVYCIDKDSGSLIWKFQTQGEIHNTNPMSHRNGILYFGSFDNMTRAVDIETGRLIWKTKVGSYGMGVAPLLHGDMILQSTRDGQLFALDMDGRVIWKYVGSDEDVMGIPAIHDGLIYIGSVGDYCMRCFSNDGKELWRFKSESFIYERSIMIGNRLIFASWDCNVYCIDTDTRQVIWKFRCSGSPSSIPPPYEAFELQTTISQKEMDDTVRKDYGLKVTEEEKNTSAYKSEITYQMGTTYREKGKYQIDSDEEEF